MLLESLLQPRNGDLKTSQLHVYTGRVPMGGMLHQIMSNHNPGSVRKLNPAATSSQSKMFADGAGVASYFQRQTLHPDLSLRHTESALK